MDSSVIFSNLFFFFFPVEEVATSDEKLPEKFILRTDE